MKHQYLILSSNLKLILEREESLREKSISHFTIVLFFLYVDQKNT